MGGLDVTVIHALRVVVFRVGNEGFVFHKAQHLVPVPFRTVGRDSFDAFLHVFFMPVEKIFKHPCGTSHDIEQQAFNAYLAEMRGKGRARFKAVGTRHV